MTLQSTEAFKGFLVVASKENVTDIEAVGSFVHASRNGVTLSQEKCNGVNQSINYVYF